MALGPDLSVLLLDTRHSQEGAAKQTTRPRTGVLQLPSHRVWVGSPDRFAPGRLQPPCNIAATDAPVWSAVIVLCRQPALPSFERLGNKMRKTKAPLTAPTWANSTCETNVAASVTARVRSAC